MIETFENKGDLHFYLETPNQVGLPKTDIKSRILDIMKAPTKPTTQTPSISTPSQPITLKNFTPRVYQQTILAQCTDKNTLVVLPTGMGKTAIALLLALQRLKHFPNSKILFLSPTRPLVEQHKTSFLKQATFDKDDLTVFTGYVKPEKREQLWKERKIIFSTPQGLENDIINERIKLEEVSLLVFDESHRATGEYAYNFIAKQYMKKASYPRVLALTASPGSDMEKILHVCQNLFIEHVELRTEKDPDVAPYIQDVKMQWVKVELPEAFRAVQKLLKKCHTTKLKEIQKLGFLHRTKIANTRKTDLLKLQGILHGEIAQGNKNYNVLKSISLAAEALKVEHALELLETQGINQLVSYLDKLQTQALSSTVKAVKNLVVDPDFKAAHVKTRILEEKNIDHPKLKKLQDMITKQAAPGKKTIIFTQYRDTASKVKDLLDSLENKDITSNVFVGQAKKRGTGLSQKEQKLMLEQFAAGEFSILIATSVAEEGIDIPAVDNVIFYEPIPSAIRHIQRRGRTGRLEKGAVQVLMAKNTRDEGYRWSAVHKERRMQRNIQEIRNNFTRLNLQSKHAFQNQITQEKDVFIMVDDREKSSKIVKELLDKGIKIRLKRLDTGDFMLSPRCAVEFKTVPDFVDSIIDGRLLSQVMQLKKNYDRPIIVVEGEEDIFSQRKIHPNAIRGMISTITVNFGIPILYTKNWKDTAAQLAITAKREQEKGLQDAPSRNKKPLSVKEKQEYLVSSLPGVGQKLSKPLLEKFGSIKNIINADITELQTIDKIGEKKAREIQKVLNGEYVQ